MMPSVNVDASKLIDKFFKIKKLQYNIYHIDHPTVKGQLRLVAVPVNVLEVPKDSLPPEAIAAGATPYVLGTAAIVGFSNRGEKKTPTKQPIQDELNKAKKEDITSFVADSPYEPWNEFILQGNPPMLLKTRTILTKLEWLPEYTDPFGAPVLNANHNTNHTIGVAPLGESGMQ
jgi:hypothetical protein